jgi:hypothetical protein
MGLLELRASSTPCPVNSPPKKYRWVKKCKWFLARGIAARENGRGEGIGLFAAKRGNGWTGVRQGLKRKWFFGESACPGESEIPLPPNVGNGMEVYFKPKSHCSGKPDGAAARKRL